MVATKESVLSALVYVVDDEEIIAKVLLFSGYVNTYTDRLIHDARNQGRHFELLTKPIHPKGLLQAIKGMVQ